MLRLSTTEVIRPYLPSDEAAAAGVWHRSGRAAYTFLPTWQQFTMEVKPTGAWQEHATGLKLGGNGPVRTNQRQHVAAASKRQG